jgi:hypothetical protein
MSSLRFSYLSVAAPAIVSGVITSCSALALAQQKQPRPVYTVAAAPGQTTQPSTLPAAYKPVTVKLPRPYKDASFEAFRKKLARIAQNKDRAALAILVSVNFFWMPDEKDVTDKRRSPIANLAKAIGLDGRDGWDILATYAAEPTAEQDPDHRNVICAPANPSFNQTAAEDLAVVTQTDSSEWAYPVRNGVEVRAQAKADSAVQEELGLYLVRVLPDEKRIAYDTDFMRVVSPSGKIGFVAADELLPLADDQLCYSKERNTWKIAGVHGDPGTEVLVVPRPLMGTSPIYSKRKYRVAIFR